MQSPPRSHRRASSTPCLRCHVPTLRCWKWRVEFDALTLVVTFAIIDGVVPSVNGCCRALLCAFVRSTRPSDDISRSLIAPRCCSARRRWIAVLNRRLGVVNPVQQQLRRATTSDDTRHSSGMAEYATLVPATCSVSSSGVLSPTVLLSAALVADSAVTDVCTTPPSDSVFVHDKPPVGRRTLYRQNVAELQSRINNMLFANQRLRAQTMARRCPRAALTSPRRRLTLSRDGRPTAGLPPPAAAAVNGTACNFFPGNLLAPHIRSSAPVHTGTENLFLPD